MATRAESSQRDVESREASRTPGDGDVDRKKQGTLSAEKKKTAEATPHGGGEGHQMRLQQKSSSSNPDRQSHHSDHGSTRDKVKRKNEVFAVRGDQQRTSEEGRGGEEGGGGRRQRNASGNPGRWRERNERGWREREGERERDLRKEGGEKGGSVSLKDGGESLDQVTKQNARQRQQQSRPRNRERRREAIERDWRDRDSVDGKDGGRERKLPNDVASSVQSNESSKSNQKEPNKSRNRDWEKRRGVPDREWRERKTGRETEEKLLGEGDRSGSGGSAGPREGGKPRKDRDRRRVVERADKHDEREAVSSERPSDVKDTQHNSAKFGPESLQKPRKDRDRRRVVERADKHDEREAVSSERPSDVKDTQHNSAKFGPESLQKPRKDRDRRRVVERADKHDEREAVSSERPSDVKDTQHNSAKFGPESSQKPSGRDRESAGGEGERKRNKKSSRPKKTPHPKDNQATPTLQSSELTQQLSAGSYSCMVCCECVRSRDAVWNCQGCYHVFHLPCIRKWATSPASLLNDADPTEGWRCPACQNACSVVPTLYKCYCGKMTNPQPRSRGDLTVPHSCVDLCGRNLARNPKSSCKHKCQLPCHPGPCPPCPIMVSRSCPCGRQSYQVRCSKTTDLPSCGTECGRQLACGRHRCSKPCHSGSCPLCQEVLTQQCYCGRGQRDVVCGEQGEEQSYKCGRSCSRELDCGNHLCELSCHPLPCPSCTLLPSCVVTCPCGATPLSVLLSPDQPRTSCLDPVPTCDHSCRKELPCSTRAQSHFCPAPCHEGSCPPCEKSRVVWCRCGKGNVRVDCVDMEGMGVFVCERPCNKMKSCGRHRCNNRCCMDSVHQCDLICNKRLQCGNHYCTEGCHKGHCDQCWEYSYDELKCHCGGEVIYPPVACGTRPPSCRQLCARMHACEHPVGHSCHSEEDCPPCTFLTEKMCMGGHELRHNIPCHISDVSCGVACGKRLPCENHNCQKTCHRGVCMDSAVECNQPCQQKRNYCSHVCGEPCHVGAECPDVPCKAEVVLLCKCGRRKERVVCGASSSGVMQQAFHKMLSKDLGAKIRDLQSGQSVSLGHVTLASLGKDDGDRLECDEVCSQEERNRTLAAALGIASPVISPLEPSPPKYSDTLVEQARKDLDFASSTEEELRSFVELVMKGLALQVRRHRFSPMPNHERKLIHELAPHYGCDSLSHDTEAERYVTVSTKKTKAKLPSVSLTKMIERERFKAVPAPVSLPSLSVKSAATERTPSPLNFSVGGKTDSGPPTGDSGGTGEEKNLETGKKVTDYFADDL